MGSLVVRGWCPRRGNGRQGGEATQRWCRYRRWHAAGAAVVVVAVVVAVVEVAWRWRRWGWQRSLRPRRPRLRRQWLRISAPHTRQPRRWWGRWWRQRRCVLLSRDTRRRRGTARRVCGAKPQGAGDWGQRHRWKEPTARCGGAGTRNDRNRGVRCDRVDNCLHVGIAQFRSSAGRGAHRADNPLLSHGQHQCPGAPQRILTPRSNERRE
mmetsp:Transcript_69130/g.174296  ORF Transcript_69130/g.174296 Transcript_69130/m.174296 type:complete len:210 (-) Transcript_69130:265-894(-)